MDRLTSLFEEDIQDQIEFEAATGDIVGESEEMIIGVMEDRIDTNDDKLHLFENKQEEPVDADGLTMDEEKEIAMALMNTPDSEINDLLDDEDY